jgi:hypothetical protein
VNAGSGGALGSGRPFYGRVWFWIVAAFVGATGVNLLENSDVADSEIVALADRGPAESIAQTASSGLETSATTASTTTTTASTTTTAAPTSTTAQPPTTAVPTTRPPTTEVPAFVAPSGCDPNYSGCVPIASDVDCAGGSGNGPEYARGPIQVIGRDIYDLDRDNDGVGCE